MARQARLDAPGTLHHIMVRGIEGRRIFEDDRDREDFLNRLGIAIEEGEARCFAWALLPNHVHLLLRTGLLPLGKLMRRLLSGYAVRFNHRHRRSGYLFQNRYRSIVCEEDSYLLELVRYIHLNGVRAGLVKDMGGLERWPWSGHSVIVERQSRPWQSREELLSHFGNRGGPATKKYLRFISEGIGTGKRKDLGSEVEGKNWEARDGNAHRDPRILGCDFFVEETLRKAKRVEGELLKVKRKRVDLDEVLLFVAKQMGVTADEMVGRSRRREISRARSVFCYVCLNDLCVTGKRLSMELGVSSAGIHLASARGAGFVRDNEEFRKSISIYLHNFPPSP
jgi:putative transposase